MFSGLPFGGSYTITPSKAALTPGGPIINTVDIVATQRHFLQIVLLSGCRLTAADVNNDGHVNTVDIVAMQRFFLAQTTGIANVGKYQFMPANRTYAGIITDQTGQDYDALIFGDVASPFGNAPDGPAQGLSNDDASPANLLAPVGTVALPNITINNSVTDFSAAVTTSIIDAKNNLVGFQGDVTFDSTVLTFQDPPVQPAGLTSTAWNVSGNILPGSGPIRTLRISAFSLDFAPLSGMGALFELRVRRVRDGAQITQLLWASPPDNFLFIDSDLLTQKPDFAAPGSVTSRPLPLR